MNSPNACGAFAYRDDQMLVLPHLGGDTYEWTAADVNDHGISVGSIRYAVRDDGGSVVEQRIRGAVWFNTEDEAVLLPPLDGHTVSSAGGINNDGLITGRSMPTRWEAGVGVAWRVDGGEVTEGPYPIEVSGMVNNAGDIIGASANGPALMRDGILLPLGSLDPNETCGAHGLSDEADGIVRIVGACGSRATLWTVNATNAVGGPVELGVPSNNSTWPQAAAVNRHGWIVGTSTTNRQGMTPTVWLPRGSSDEACKPHPKHADRCR